MDAVGASQGGAGLWGLRALQRGKRDIESGRLNESPGDEAKERDYLPQWKGEVITVDRSKTVVCGRRLA